MKTSLWHTLTPNSYLKTNSLAGKNSFSFVYCLIYQLNNDLRTSQHFSRGEKHQHFVFLSLHCKFLKISFSSSHCKYSKAVCSSIPDFNKEAVLLIVLSQRDLVINIMQGDLFCPEDHATSTSNNGTCLRHIKGTC